MIKILDFFHQDREKQQDHPTRTSCAASDKAQRAPAADICGGEGCRQTSTTIERAMVIIDAAKQTERIHHVPVPGHRRRRWCSAQDVVAWLRKVKNIKISLKTVRADIRVLKEKTL